MKKLKYQFQLNDSIARNMKRIVISVFTTILLLVVLLFWDNKPSLYVEKQTGPWSVGYTFTDNLDDIESKVGINFIDSTSVINPVQLNFLADPFLYIDTSGSYVFVEYITTGHGNIACFYAPYSEAPRFEFKGVVLDETFHLSYPQVFRYKSKFYMLPETQGGGSVILYETDNFPYDWKRSRILINDNTIKDPTLLVTGDKIQLFGTKKDRLYCWQAESLSDTFILNDYPLLAGTESRPGGRIFRYENRAIIPIQNNLRGYGTALSLYEICDEKNRLYLKPFRKRILHPRENINQFTHGMHHLDIQPVGIKYFAVFDGNGRKGPDQIDIKQFTKFCLLNLENEYIMLRNRFN